MPQKVQAKKNDAPIAPLVKKPVITKLQGGLFLGTIATVGLLIGLYMANARFSSLLNRAVRPDVGIPIGVFVIIGMIIVVVAQVFVAIGRYSRDDSQLMQRLNSLEHEMQADKKKHAEILAKLEKEAKEQQEGAQSEILGLKNQLLVAQQIRSEQQLQADISGLRSELTEAHHQNRALTKQVEQATREKERMQLDQCEDRRRVIALEQQVNELKGKIATQADQTDEDRELREEALRAMTDLRQLCENGMSTLEQLQQAKASPAAAVMGVFGGKAQALAAVAGLLGSLTEAQKQHLNGVTDALLALKEPRAIVDGLIKTLRDDLKIPADKLAILENAKEHLDIDHISNLLKAGSFNGFQLPAIDKLNLQTAYTLFESLKKLNIASLSSQQQEALIQQLKGMFSGFGLGLDSQTLDRAVRSTVDYFRHAGNASSLQGLMPIFKQLGINLPPMAGSLPSSASWGSALKGLFGGGI